MADLVSLCVCRYAIRIASNDTYTNVQTAINIYVIYFLLGLSVLMELHNMCSAGRAECSNNKFHLTHKYYISSAVAPKSIHSLEIARVSNTARSLHMRVERVFFAAFTCAKESAASLIFPMTQIKKIVEESN